MDIFNAISRIHKKANSHTVLRTHTHTHTYTRTIIYINIILNEI